MAVPLIHLSLERTVLETEPYNWSVLSLPCPFNTRLLYRITYATCPATMSSNSNPALLLDGDQAATVVTVHPLVLLSVLDHHARRQEANGRVIGTLLGRRNGSSVRFLIEIHP